MDAGTLMLIGTGVQAGSKVAGGMAARDAGNYNAAALDTQATQEVAAAQRTAAERRRATDRVISKQIAVGAASGAGAGPSLLDVIGDTAQQGEYLAQADMFGGEEKARALRNKAAIAKYEGKSAYAGSLLEGIGGLALGAGKYGLNYGTSTRTTPIGPWRTTVSYG